MQITPKSAVFACIFISIHVYGNGQSDSEVHIEIQSTMKRKILLNKNKENTPYNTSRLTIKVQLRL